EAFEDYRAVKPRLIERGVFRHGALCGCESSAKLFTVASRSPNFADGYCKVVPISRIFRLELSGTHQQAPTLQRVSCEQCAYAGCVLLGRITNVPGVRIAYFAGHTFDAQAGAIDVFLAALPLG